MKCSARIMAACLAAAACCLALAAGKEPAKAAGDVSKLDAKKMEDKGFIHFNGYWVSMMRREQLIKQFPVFTVANGLHAGVDARIDGAEPAHLDSMEQQRFFLDPGEHEVIFAIKERKSKPIKFSVMPGKESRMRLLPREEWPALDIRIPDEIVKESETKGTATHAPRKGKDVKITLTKGNVSRTFIKKAYTRLSEIALGIDGKSMDMDREALKGNQFVPTACYIFHGHRPGKFISDGLAGYLIHDPLSQMELGEMGLKHLNSNEHSYRDVHIAVLAEARTKGVKKDLLEMLADDEEPERNQLAAARALGALASPEDAAAMDKLAKGNLPDPVKEALAASLKAVRERAEIPKLVNALKVSGEREQVDAISALRDCAADVDPDVFVKVLKTAQNSALREIAAEGLDRMKRPEAMEALLDFADDKSAAVREQIAKSAGTRLSWRAIPVLLRFLKDSEATVRKAAAVALSNLGVVEAVPGLLALLDDPDGDVAQAAGEALKQITREPMPFDSRWPEKERKEAIQNWRKWWEK